MYVIGTAGHVDHGKSTLIEAITGRHPDRLTEERERELSIVLGFDSMTLESGEQVGIIDVPGHRDFIENMLSGIGGIDAVLFVVAADEGVMPQTEEHLAIIDLLGIDDGVVALTKIDAVDDPEWLELVEADLQETLQDTTLGSAPIVRVSGKTGQGVDSLVQTIEDRLASHPPRPDLGRPRLSVDRTFTISGFGTVVTGTLLDGVFQEGEEIVLLPKRIKGRIRGLQVHDQKVSNASPGSRTAINISGVNVDEIDRGDVVAHPGDYQPTRRLDVRYTSLPDTLKPLTHNTRAKLFLGADEVWPGSDFWNRNAWRLEKKAGCSWKCRSRWSLCGGIVIYYVDPLPQKLWEEGLSSIPIQNFAINDLMIKFSSGCTRWLKGMRRRLSIRSFRVLA